MKRWRISTPFSAARCSGVVAFALLAGGCAAPYEGTYAFGDGWREARVTEVAEGQRISRGATADCRKKTTWRAGDSFARVEYSFSARLKLTYITGVHDASDFRSGDKVYANIRDCSAPIVPRSAEARERSGT